MKLLTLTTKNFFSGIASGSHIERGGLWASATGINPFINPVQGSVDTGLLQASPVPTEITGGVGGTPLSATTRVTGSATGTTYIGTSLGVSQIDMSGDNNATTVATIVNMTNGLELFQSKGTTREDLLYWQKTQIGRYGDLNGVPTATNAYLTGLESTSYHPTHKMWDEIYYGNKNKIGQIKDNGAGGLTHSPNILDFEGNMLVTALSDDGQFLVVGLSTNQGDNSIYGHTLIRFWKINAPSWTYEWSIPETNIISIRREGGSMYAICPGGEYIFNSATPPRKVHSTSNSSPFGMDNSTSVLGQALFMGRSSGVGMYGKMLPDVPTAYHEPLSGGTGTTTLIVANARLNRILVGTDTPKLYRYDITSGGGVMSGKTVYIPLGERHDINNVEVVLGEPLIIGDSFSISLQADEDTAPTAWGTYSFARWGGKKRISMSSQKAMVDNLSITINFLSGTPKIKEINIYGQKNHVSN